MNLQIDHVSIAVSNVQSVQNFYDSIMPIVGAKKVDQSNTVLKYGVRNRPLDCDHSYVAIVEDTDFTVTKSNHWCFRVDNRDIVDEFHRNGLANGGTDGGKPGVRSNYHDDYYAAFLIDPCGNKIEAVCHLLF